jgi:hypothetical protein
VPVGGRLGAVLTALLAPDPADRPGSAAEAREALAAAPALRPLTAGGDPVEVLDQLPELPPGWTPAGPPRPGPPPRSPGPRARPGRWVAAALLGALATAAAIGLAAQRGPAAPPARQPTTSTPASTPTQTPASTQTPTRTRTGPSPAEECGWQQEGDLDTDPAGRTLRCVRTADGYRWALS